MGKVLYMQQESGSLIFIARSCISYFYQENLKNKGAERLDQKNDVISWLFIASPAVNVTDKDLKRFHA